MRNALCATGLAALLWNPAGLCGTTFDDLHMDVLDRKESPDRALERMARQRPGKTKSKETPDRAQLRDGAEERGRAFFFVMGSPAAAGQIADDRMFERDSSQHAGPDDPNWGENGGEGPDDPNWGEQDKDGG